MKSALLQDRALIAVAGADATTLFQGLVTADLDQLAEKPNIFAALLQPQGKIQFDFFIHASDFGLIIDINRQIAPSFLKKMMLYKLRSDVTFKEMDAHHKILATWNHDATAPLDARLDALGARQVVKTPVETNASEDDYHAHRIGLGIPEGGKDFDWDEIFPHDAMMDRLKGVDFEKGCYVGQEVVSRMKHRGTARKRFFHVKSDTQLPEQGSEIRQNDKIIGTMGSNSGSNGLALLRTDRLSPENAAVLAGRVEAEVRLPDYFTKPDD